MLTLHRGAVAWHSHLVLVAPACSLLRLEPDQEPQDPWSPAIRAWQPGKQQGLPGPPARGRGMGPGARAAVRGCGQCRLVCALKRGRGVEGVTAGPLWPSSLPNTQGTSRPDLGPLPACPHPFFKLHPLTAGEDVSLISCQVSVIDRHQDLFLPEGENALPAAVKLSSVFSKFIVRIPALDQISHFSRTDDLTPRNQPRQGCERGAGGAQRKVGLILTLREAGQLTVGGGGVTIDV